MQGGEQVLEPVHDWAAGFEQTWNVRLDRLEDLLTTLHNTDPQPEQEQS